MLPLPRVVVDHLASSQVARTTYGAIIGLALVVALEAHPPGPGTVAALLAGTAIAVGLAELYSDILGAETRTKRHVARTEVAHMAEDGIAVAIGVGFPAVFFLLAELGAFGEDTAFAVAKWSGLGLIAFYGYCAGRLAGERQVRSIVQALAVAAIGAALIGLKALLH